MISRFSTVVVGGIELSGISTTVVTPPDSAALVPVQKPSQCVRPGSFKCTCVLLGRNLSAIDCDGIPGDVLYESGKDDVITSVDDFGVVVDSAQGTFDDGDNGPLFSIDNNGSLDELIVAGKKDPGAVEDELV